MGGARDIQNMHLHTHLHAHKHIPLEAWPYDSYQGRVKWKQVHSKRELYFYMMVSIGTIQHHQVRKNVTRWVESIYRHGPGVYVVIDRSCMCVGVCWGRGEG
jgi:hypothetical protein